jgi:aerobic carbon-monoxide dehydrogenase large subunit
MRIANRYIGSPIERREDLRFLRGRGEYVDDLERPGLLHAVILRSPLAHARIRAIDAAPALALPGVHAVLTAADFAGPVPRVPIRLQPMASLEPFHQPVLAEKKVRYAGEPVAVVLADNIALGEDAVDAIGLEFEPLPAAVDRSSPALLFEEAGNNLAVEYTAACGNAAAAFAKADYTRREHFSAQRHAALTMEPRGLLAEWDAAEGRLTVLGASKVTFFNRRILAALIGLPEDRIDLVENDVGGGFGQRGEFYPEDFLIPYAARHIGRPVKWIEDRREHLTAANHARQVDCEIEIACRRDGTMLALRAECHVDIGAYTRTNGMVGGRNVAQMLSGPYRIPDQDIRSALYLSNKTPVGTYRGPGRFEADFFRERLIDMVAKDLGLDRIEFRRRNLVTSAEMPYPLPTITPYERKDELDSGDYAATLDRCLREFGWAERMQRAGKQVDGRYHGVALGCFVEGGAAGPQENARLVLEEDGSVCVYVGSSAVGQGVETSFAQIAADALEIPIERIRGVFHGSTSFVAAGWGSFHSRATVMAGSAILAAAERLKAEIRAAQPDAGDILDALPALAGRRLSVEESFHSDKHTYAYGAHAAEVAVDPKTGHIAVIDYVAVEDVGRIVNPLLLEGQVVGALVQGLGGALFEHLVYDADGNLLTGTLADYLLPTADAVPRVRTILLEDHPSPNNPLGAKGAGEGGLIPTAGLIANAVASALGEFGVEPRELPLSPARLWGLLWVAKQL